MFGRKSRKEIEQDPPIRPQLYISVMLVMVMIVLAFMGQWDWVLAVFLGLLLGNGLSTFIKGP
jgi:hypothetical protein